MTNKCSCFLLIYLILFLISCKDNNQNKGLIVLDKNHIYKISDEIEKLFVLNKNGLTEEIALYDGEYMVLCLISEQCYTCSTVNSTILNRMAEKFAIKIFGLTPHDQLLERYNSGSNLFPFFLIDKKATSQDSKLLSKFGDVTIMCRGRKIVFVKYGSLDMQDYLEIKKILNH